MSTGTVGAATVQRRAPQLDLNRLPRGLKCPRMRHASRKRADAENLRFYPCSVLGQGTYGQVFQCWDAHTRQHVAVKKFRTKQSSGNERNDAETSTGIAQASFRELAILQRCSHPNIVPVLALVFDAAHKHYFCGRFDGGFAMPLCRGGDLHHWLIKEPSKAVRPHVKQRLARQLLDAVCYLHQRSIVHRDIKPGNCMIDETDGRGARLLLGDFGLGRQCTVPLRPWYTGAVCTLWYRPPELLFGSRSYGFGLDIWSTGLTIARLFAADDIFQHGTEIALLFDIFQVFGTPCERDWPEMLEMRNYTRGAFPRFDGCGIAARLDADTDRQAVDLLERMLRCNPKERLSAKQALKHPYIQRRYRTRNARMKKDVKDRPPTVKRRRIAIQL